MERLAQTGHGSEGLVVFPPRRVAVVEFGLRTDFDGPEPFEGVLLGEWDDPDPPEVPVSVGEWDDALVVHDVTTEEWDA